MNKLILQCHLSPGDIVMLTAAVRDLHRCYPGKFLTDVRTSGKAIWENNPHITPIADDDPDARWIACSYPLINQSHLPYHCLHGFIQFLNSTLGLDIRPSEFKGDIHLSAQEKAWHSQVHELTRSDIPFWLVAAGGKYDVTIKWWDAARYQKVIDHFHGKIQFVQVGADGHFHPKLKGAIDLRGRTNLRELIRLVYHAQGVLCGVTALMHLAAALEVKPGAKNRPGVVVAGGREPAHWEAYPEHQFISNNGTLWCCTNGACWKGRTAPLGDGDERDRPEHLCLNLAGPLPRCMDMITADDVCRRIEMFFDGGNCNYLTEGDFDLGARAVEATVDNPVDLAPLTIENAGLALNAFIKQIPPFPDGRFSGRGIVICGGGAGYLAPAWVCVKMLRRLGCQLEIELWHLGPAEVPRAVAEQLRLLNVHCIDALEVAQRHPVRRRLTGWPLKAFAILHSRFRELVYLDADNVPVRNPTYLFDAFQYRETGAIFWPDYEDFQKGENIWESCGLKKPKGPEFESGQIVVDKARCWAALRLALWFNENSDFYYRHLHGDKETFRLAFHKLKKAYGFIELSPYPLLGTMCQHDFEGNRFFQHRNTDKWNIFPTNPRFEGFEWDQACREAVAELQQYWDGGASIYATSLQPAKRSNPISLIGCMISHRGRQEMREKTLRCLAQTDWADDPLIVELDAEADDNPHSRQLSATFNVLGRCLETEATHFLFLEDDLEFNHWIKHNLLTWPPLIENRVTVATLYNPGFRALGCNWKETFSLIAPEGAFGSQAVVLRRDVAEHILAHWNTIEGLQDTRIFRLAAQIQSPMFMHTPSLVQHVGKTSVWGGRFHMACDFNPNWKR